MPSSALARQNRRWAKFVQLKAADVSVIELDRRLCHERIYCERYQRADEERNDKGCRLNRSFYEL
ncbi:protein of unknown function [Methylocella tundrae]|uniref:Uncharacterized protein n=1 Tax=Methylocella tundrae TaxID=227605 RepID=A0A4U8YUM1_METTU|nr:protein of unknown function [Methylocella tundrae]